MLSCKRCFYTLVQLCGTTMEKPPFRQNQNCGDWELKERLGMGGFAHVYLYQHHVSVEPLTLHTCDSKLQAERKKQTPC